MEEWKTKSGIAIFILATNALLSASGDKADGIGTPFSNERLIQITGASEIKCHTR